MPAISLWPSVTQEKERKWNGYTSPLMLQKRVWSHSLIISQSLALKAWVIASPFSRASTSSSQPCTKSFVTERAIYKSTVNLLVCCSAESVATTVLGDLQGIVPSSEMKRYSSESISCPLENTTFSTCRRDTVANNHKQREVMAPFAAVVFLTATNSYFVWQMMLLSQPKKLMNVNSLLNICPRVLVIAG